MLHKMRASMNRLKDMRMERKLILVFLLIITLPLFLISYISYNNYSDSIEDNTIAYSKTVLSKMMERTDDYIEDMIRISSIPAYVDEIRTNLIRSNEYEKQKVKGEDSHALPRDFDTLLMIQRGIEDNISFINTIKRGANSVYIFDQFGNGYYTAKSGGVRLDIPKSYEQWKLEASESNGEAVLVSTQKFVSNLQSTRYAFTVVRKVIDRSLNPIGLIAVDADIRFIEDQVIGLDQLTKGNTVIVDEHGHAIYDSEKKWVATNIQNEPIIQQAKGGSGSFYEMVNGEEHLFIYTTSENTNWKVLISIPVKELTREAAVIRNVTWFATGAVIILALAVSIVFSYALTKPLRKMIALMRKVQIGDLNVQFQVKHRDEMGQLGNQFNRMLSRIRHLIQDIYEMESQKKEAELHALQSQINPHFIYNTLEAIRMMAEINDDTEAADMISLLGKLMRYSISDLREVVTIEKELEHVRNYVEILNYRYPNRFVLTETVPRKH
ncbi:cache domain-containing sensor histidine kinase [Marinicrinis sediminis]|uniref:Sensor histidine kinase n=1 Tax=Marinicrinis sediminis TaxID=1652465 RepID=A0ABW5R8I5_9BACL